MSQNLTHLSWFQIFWPSAISLSKSNINVSQISWCLSVTHLLQIWGRDELTEIRQAVVHPIATTFLNDSVRLGILKERKNVHNRSILQKKSPVSHHHWWRGLFGNKSLFRTFRTCHQLFANLRLCFYSSPNPKRSSSNQADHFPSYRFLIPCATLVVCTAGRPACVCWTVFRVGPKYLHSPQGRWCPPNFDEGGGKSLPQCLCTAPCSWFPPPHAHIHRHDSLKLTLVCRTFLMGGSKSSFGFTRKFNVLQQREKVVQVCTSWSRFMHGRSKSNQVQGSFPLLFWNFLPNVFSSSCPFFRLSDTIHFYARL